ncbi:MAG: hypothetical protein MHMPM18_000461 [Marteilia pararefringens]
MRIKEHKPWLRFFDKQKNSQDQENDIPSVELKNYFTTREEYEEVCDELKKNDTIKKLTIRKCSLDLADPSLIKDTLTSLNRLAELDLSSNRLSSEFLMQFLAYFSNQSSLRKLSLASTGLNHSSCSYLVELINENKYLELLDISDNALDCTCVRILSQPLADNVSIKELDISRNHLKDTGLKLLFQSLTSNVFLKTLKVSKNHKIARDSATNLIEMLRKNSSLLHLVAEDCLMSSDLILTIVSSLESFETIKILDLRDNSGLQSGEKKQLVEKLRGIDKEMEFECIDLRVSKYEVSKSNEERHEFGKGLLLL